MTFLFARIPRHSSSSCPARRPPCQEKFGTFWVKLGPLRQGEKKKALISLSGDNRDPTFKKKKRTIQFHPSNERRLPLKRHGQ